MSTDQIYTISLAVALIVPLIFRAVRSAIKRKNCPVQNLKWGDEVSFIYDGVLFDDGMFITLENSTADLGCHPDPEPNTPYPRLRLMFAGSTFGRFELSKITELRVK